MFCFSWLFVFLHKLLGSHLGEGEIWRTRYFWVGSYHNVGLWINFEKDKACAPKHGPGRERHTAHDVGELELVAW